METTKAIDDVEASQLYRLTMQLPSFHVDPNPQQVVSITELVNQGISLNCSDSDGLTPLHWATSKENSYVVQLLLDHGANVNACTKLGAAGNTYCGYEGTPLQVAVNKDNFPLVNLLLRHRADANRYNAAGDTPLIRAAVWGNVEIVRTLIACGGDVNSRVICHIEGLYVPGETVLHVAIHNLHPPLVELLLQRGADLNLRDQKGRSPVTLIENRLIRYRCFGLFPEDRLAAICTVIRDFQAKQNREEKASG
jgi:ankyrin repeat protein